MRVLPLWPRCRADVPTSLRKSTGDKKYYAPLEQQEYSLFHMILFSCLTPFSELGSVLLSFPLY